MRGGLRRRQGMQSESMLEKVLLYRRNLRRICDKHQVPGVRRKHFFPKQQRPPLPPTVNNLTTTTPTDTSADDLELTAEEEQHFQ